MKIEKNKFTYLKWDMTEGMPRAQERCKNMCLLLGFKTCYPKIRHLGILHTLSGWSLRKWQKTFTLTFPVSPLNEVRDAFLRPEGKEHSYLQDKRTPRRIQTHRPYKQGKHLNYGTSDCSANRPPSVSRLRSLPHSLAKDGIWGVTAWLAFGSHIFMGLCRNFVFLLICLDQPKNLMGHPFRWWPWRDQFHWLHPARSKAPWS